MINLIQKNAAKVGLDASLKASIVPDDAIIDLRNLVRDYYYFKDLQSAIVLKLHAELKVSFPSIPECVQQGHNADFLKASGSLPPCSGHACRPKMTSLWKSSAARRALGQTYALARYDAICTAAKGCRCFRTCPFQATLCGSGCT